MPDVAMSPTALQYEEQRYVHIAGFLEDPLLSVAYRYMLMKAETGQGNWKGTQVPESMSIYADPLMETLLEYAWPRLEQLVEKRLWPTYSFCRLYKRGDVLTPHKDRISCEISASLCLGRDVAAIEAEQPDYQWPLYVEGLPLRCLPGDLIVYHGCEQKHWREAFEGENQAHVFLHFVDRDGPYGEVCKFDARPRLGMPIRSRDKEKITQMQALNRRLVQQQMRRRRYQ